MDAGSSQAVRFGASQDFSGDGGDFADTKEQEAEEIGGGIAFGPFEVDVRLLAGYVSDVQQERGKGVRDGRAFESQHSVLLVHDYAMYVKLGSELRRVSDGDLYEDEVLVLGEIMIAENLAAFFGVFSGVAFIWLVGHEADGAPGAIADE
jgi:hypothetical protein